LPASLLAGALLGVALYSYAAAYALPFVVGLSILAFWLSAKRTERPAIRQLITYSLAFALVIVPLFIFALESPDFFGLHLETTSASSSMTVVENIGGTLGGIFLNGDRFAAYNLPGRPLLDVVQTLFMLLGLVVCVRRIKQPEFCFVLIWSTFALLPAIFSAWSPAFNRMAAAVPGLIVLVSIGGLETYRFLAQLAVQLSARRCDARRRFHDRSDSDRLLHRLADHARSAFHILHGRAGPGGSHRRIASRCYSVSFTGGCRPPNI
jgi:hypothetical protein